MLHPPYLRPLTMIVTIIVLASVFVPVLADCVETPNPSGIDYYCTDTTHLVDGTPASDNIVNDGTITTYMWSGGFSFNPDQQDTLINNGIVGTAVNDDGIFGGAGKDTIINNGVVHGGPVAAWEGIPGAIFGDATEGIADNDTITNNGIVHGNMHGDLSAGGDDTIIINGQVNGGVYGEGQESVLFERYGDDIVILMNAAVVTTVIDGMGGNDTLRFDFTIADHATYNALSWLIAAANPAGGSLTFNSNTLTWRNFEILENSIEWTGEPSLPPMPTSLPNGAPLRHFSAGQPFDLTWNVISWAQGYVIEIDQDADFSSPIIATEVPASVQSYPVPFLGNGVYYWRVKARRDSSTPGEWGLTESFSIYAPATPTPGS